MSQFDAFLKIEGINGETEDKMFAHQIELLSYSFGASQAGSFQYGGGGATGKVQFQDFHFAKRADEATPLLFDACCCGKHIGNCELSLRKSTGDGGQQVFYKVTFTDVLISSQTVSGQGHNDPIPTESISFNFARMVMAYGKQDKFGKVGPMVPKGWDLKQNYKV